jgi:proline iminopeptidase
VACFRTVDDVEVFYECRGSGPRLFACHGGPAEDHRYLAEDLAGMQQSREVVFHHYRGSGQSAIAPPETYTIERLADDLDELRAHLGEDQIDLLGHSMGGWVAQVYALRHPEHCRRLLLVGTWSTMVPKEMLPPTFRALGWARNAKMLGRALWWCVAWSWRRGSPERTRRGFVIWAPMQEGLPAVRAREVERERRLGYPIINNNTRPLQRHFMRWSVHDRLGRIACPALVLYGTRDAAAVVGSRYFRDMPDAEFVCLPDVGHDALFEAPEHALAALHEFLGSKGE